MRNSTLCYIENGNRYLMLHRIKKKNDLNHDKWVAVGGGFEDKESPEECLLREVREETGLLLTSYRLRGIVTFVSDIYETEYMYVYTANGYTGELTDCDEGVPEWIEKEKIKELPQWEGDRIFFDYIENNEPFFSLKLEYEGDKLVYAAKDGKTLSQFSAFSERFES